MVIIGDLLTASTPTRLLCRRGNWSLEIEQLVAVERDVYQPRTQRLEGTGVVLQHLRTANTALAHAASTLIRSTHAGEECAFEALDSEWVPCDTKRAAESIRPSAQCATNATVLELRAELCLMRATHAALRDRLARLESELASANRMRELGRPRSLAPVSPAPPAALPLARPGANESVASAPPPPPVPAAPARSERAISERAIPAPPSKQGSPLKLPSAAAIAVCLKTLVGKKIGVREVRPKSHPVDGKQLHWFSTLIDDEGKDVGALVTDLFATIGLGGALMMIPPAELDAQRAQQKPSEDVMSAMTEVMNNLSATINQVPEALHVRVQALQAMADGNLDWTRTAAQVVALELDDGMGHLLLFAR